jgi:hypothetical protein
MIAIPEGVVLADTITKLGAESYASVIVSGSHGGVYPAYLARRAGARAVILNDAGVGRDNAGIDSLGYGQALGMAAATVSYQSARIGDTADMLQRGVISHINELAEAAGCRVGMSCAEAAQILTTAGLSPVEPQPYSEARTVITGIAGNRQVICLDSVSLVQPEDADQIILTGSHGGLVGGDKAMALKVDALLAVYNDAGIGIDDAGIGRLPALDDRGIAAATVAADSARIGDGVSTYTEGVLSMVNETAAMLGGRAGMTARELVDLIMALD